MELNTATNALGALAHPTRLQAFRLLVQAGSEGLPVGRIAERLGVEANGRLTFHLKELVAAGLASSRQEGRFVYYATDYAAMNDLLRFLTEDCCGGLGCGEIEAVCSPPPNRETAMEDKVYNVLFLCTGNSARSIIAEALLNHLGRGRFRAFSAGSHPAGTVNPLVLEALASLGLPAEQLGQLRSKSWDEFAQPDSPALDFVFTVCDKAAGETCPVWPGQPMTAHWGIEDPAAVEGDDEAKRHAVSHALQLLNRRLSLFLSLPFEKLDALSLQQQVDDIGLLREQGR